MKIKPVLALALCACMLLGLVAVPPVHAADTTVPAHSANIGDHEYVYDRWAKPIKSYLVPHEDGTLTRVDYTGEAVAAEIYDSDLKFVSGCTIDMELPLFGGFYYGETCNFLVFGQENPNEDDDMEVLRVVSYTRDWQRIGAASLSGANTCIPFDAGSLRFAECNAYLYIRTAHEMYMSDDGFNHQANMTLNVRIADMVITDSFYEVGHYYFGYVSHSFNQFIAVDGTDLLAVDHGDAHPRSVVLMRYCTPAGQDKFTNMKLIHTPDGHDTFAYVEYVDVLPISGSYGANDTGVSLGGFEFSDSAYLIVGNTGPQGNDYDPFGQRNIFVSVTSKENFSADGTEIHYLTSYTKGDEVVVSNPHFVKINGNKFAVIWTEKIDDSSTMRYAFLDGNGQLIGKIYSAKGVLSDCQPVVFDNKLVWYATGASAPVFFAIDLESMEINPHDHVYSYQYELGPTSVSDGALRGICAVCGELGPKIAVPSLKNTDAYTLIYYTEVPTCTGGGYGYFRWNDIDKYNIEEIYFGSYVPPLGHERGEKGPDGHAACIRCSEIHEWTSATCTEPETCPVCGQTRGEAQGHNYNSGVITTKPTCTEPGERTYTCVDCGDTRTEAEAPKGHTYWEYVVKPLCDQEGYTVHYCYDCLDRYVDNYTDPLGHSYSYEVTAAPTVDAAGTLTGVCSGCSDIDVVTLPMLNDTDYTYTVGQGPTDPSTDIGRYTWNNTTYGTLCFEVKLADVMLGDVDGNGVIDTTDYMRVKAAFLGTFALSEAEFKAADVDKNGTIDTTDYMRIKAHFLGTYVIE